MSLPLTARPEVAFDVREAYEWYQGEGPGLGEKFLANLQATRERIAQMPERFGRVFRSLRAAKVPRFPYVVYFHIRRDHQIRIVAVMHGKRAAKHWRRRLR